MQKRKEERQEEDADQDEKVLADRAKGVLMGLCAGDRNGGPVRMAVRLAESLIEKQTYDREDVIRRYHAWYKDPPYDTDAPVEVIILLLAHDPLDDFRAARLGCHRVHVFWQRNASIVVNVLQHRQVPSFDESYINLIVVPAASFDGPFQHRVMAPLGRLGTRPLVPIAFVHGVGSDEPHEISLACEIGADRPRLVPPCFGSNESSQPGEHSRGVSSFFRHSSDVVVLN